MFRILSLAALAALATPGLAQNTDPAPAPAPAPASTLPDPNDQSDQFTIGVGGGWPPTTAARTTIA
jgi:hypothetical protein